MRNDGRQKEKGPFFEGWYLKHQAGDQVISVIPTYHVDENGHGLASIQVITKEKSFYIPYSKEEWRACKKKFKVRVGDNLFWERGMKLDIQTVGLTLKGTVSYDSFTPLTGNIMGPFCLFPFLPCNHGILSLRHKLRGSLTLNGQRMELTGGVGYIEKDWGSSFPRAYLWTQCGWREDERDHCVMAAIAEIPLLGSCFTGCICSVYYKGKEYRLATYRGARVVRHSKNEILLRQGKYWLEVTVDGEKGQCLKAPECGQMTRTIHENLCCRIRYRFGLERRVIFDVERENASFECASCSR